MKIHRLKKILEPETHGRLWSFYQSQFADLNCQTPLSQTLGRRQFVSWLTSSRATKFLLNDEAGSLFGFAVVSSDLRHDPLISIPFFRKHFSEKRVFHFPVITINRAFARKYPTAHLVLMKDMMAIIPKDGVAVFFHSETENPVMPRLIRKSCAPKIITRQLDAMRCVLLEWS